MIWFGNTEAMCLKLGTLNFAPFISITAQLTHNSLLSLLKAVTLKLMVFCNWNFQMKTEGWNMDKHETYNVIYYHKWHYKYVLHEFIELSGFQPEEVVKSLLWHSWETRIEARLHKSVLISGTFFETMVDLTSLDLKQFFKWYHLRISSSKSCLFWIY